MIQRKQSIYLLLMTVICAVMLLADFPISKGILNDKGTSSPYRVSVMSGEVKELNVFNNQELITAIVLSSLLSLATIFMFRKLALQRRLVVLNFGFIILMILLMIQAHFKMDGEAYSVQSATYQFGFIVPLILAALNFLSLSGIKKDIELLASVDRLR